MRAIPAEYCPEDINGPADLDRLSALSTAAAAAPLEAPRVAEKVTIEPHGRAYLFRGLIALIDWGMDELAQQRVCMQNDVQQWALRRVL